jgi:cell division protease FtsH
MDARHAGADLANLLNEAAILAGRRNLKSISLREIDDSVDRIVAGMEGKPLTDGKAKALVAYHEVGHAVCSTLTPGHDAVQKVTLIPRGQARGLTWFQPGDDPTLISKQQMFARIVGALGGRAAEEVIFGAPEVTTGASSDLQQVTQLAKQMVINYGFSDIGPWSLMDPSGQSGDMIMRMMARNSMSEALQVCRLDLYCLTLCPLHLPKNIFWRSGHMDLACVHSDHSGGSVCSSETWSAYLCFKSFMSV